MGNKDSKETQSSQDGDESDADSSLAENLSTLLGTQKQGDNNKHDTILGSDADLLDCGMAAEETTTVTAGEADLDVQQHASQRQGVAGRNKELLKSETNVQSVHSLCVGLYAGTCLREMNIITSEIK